MNVPGPIQLILDGFTNVLTGLGTTADKMQSTTWRVDSQPVAADDQYAGMYERLWLARRVVQVYPEHALRKRPDFGDSVQDPDALWEKWDALNVTELYPHGVLAQALYQGRLFGGALLLPGFRYGKPTDPAPEPGPQSEIVWLDVVKWRDLRIDTWETDRNSPRYGQPLVMTVQGDHKRAGYQFHASRSISCEGAPRAVSRKSDKTPWLSVLDPVIETLIRYDSAWAAVGLMLSEASVGVLKLSGLIGMLAGKDQTAVQNRMQLMSQGRSVAKTVFLDAELKEDYTRTEVAFTGIPALLEQFALQVSGCTEIPVAILLGQEPAGLNATGENDRAQFDDKIAVYQRQNLKPKQTKLLSWVNGEQVVLTHPPIREMTEAERATLRKDEAATDKVYYDLGVLDVTDIVEARGESLGIDVTKKLAAIAAEAEELPEGARIEVTPTAAAASFSVNEVRLSAGVGRDPDPEYGEKKLIEVLTEIEAQKAEAAAANRPEPQPAQQPDAPSPNSPEQ